MNKLDTQLAQLVAKLQEAGFTNAPEIVDGAIRAIYYDGIVQLTFFIMTIIIVLLTGYATYLGATNKSSLDSESIPFFGFTCFVFTVLSMLIGSVGNPWLMIFDPTASFYQDIMTKLLG